MIKGLTASTISPLFLEHIAEHGLMYATSEEFQFRQNIFLQKEAEIQVSNADEKNTFTLGHNHMSTWTDEEYKQLLGYKAQATNETVEYKVLEAGDVPASIDWRTKGAVNPVKNQGQCGSCWAFSATCAIEGHYEIKNDKLLSFSEQQLVDCVTKDLGCNGGMQADAMDYVKTTGQTLESSYTYHAKQGTCADSQYKKYAYVSAVNAVTPLSADQLIAAIAQGPVSVTVEADQWAFQLYRGGVLNSQSCGTNLDHAITGIGYGSEGGQQYFIVRNSWGARWGEEGYIRIATEAGSSKGICGIQQDSVWPNMQ